MKYTEALTRATQGRRDRDRSWSDEDFRAQRDRDLAPSAMSIGQVVRATLVCLLVAALLSSARLVEIAQRQPFGGWRDFWLDAATAVDRVANALALNRPADFVADLRDDAEPGRGTDDLDRFLDRNQPASPATSPPVSVGSADPLVESTTTAPPAEPVEPAEPEPVETLGPTDRLAILTIGDSQAEPLGYEIINQARENWDVALDTRISTGLSRPDVFNWPAQIEAIMGSDDPPRVVVMFLGGNDAQDMRRGGKYFALGSPEWADEYRVRVEIAMDVMRDAQVLWVDQPPVADATVTATARVMNEIYTSEAAARHWVDLVDASTLFGGPEEEFDPFLELLDGSTIKARQDDGVHLTSDGATVLAGEVAAVIDARFPSAGDGGP